MVGVVVTENKVRHEVVEVSAATPVGSEASKIVSLKLRNIPSSICRVLLIRPGVLVDIDGSLWEAVTVAEGIEVGDGGVRLAFPAADLMPRVDVRNRVVLRDVGRPGVPFLIVHVG